MLQDIVTEDCFHSLIVFMPECEFKTTMPNNIFKGTAWVDEVKKYQQPIIPKMKLKRVQLRLEKEILEKRWKTNQRHIEHIKNLQAQKSIHKNSI